VLDGDTSIIPNLLAPFMQIEDIIDQLHRQRLTHPTPKAMKDARGHESREACCPGGTNEAGDELYTVSH
jgi:hypothetical protein